MQQQTGYILFFLLIYQIISSQVNPQSKEITKKFFSEFEFVENNTPALKKNKGYTNYKELLMFLRDLTRKHPNKIKLSFIGESQKGKKIPIVHLENPNNQEEKIKIWMQAGLHGNEPASTEGILYLLDKLLNDKKYTHLLNQVSLAVVPMANIDGYLKMKRNAANGLDLNRDQTKLMAPETIVLKRTYNNFLPDVAVDFHEYKPYRKHYKIMGRFGITSMYDVMFLSSGNLNVPISIRKLTDTLFIKNTKDSLSKYGLTHSPYMTSKKVKGEIQFSFGSLNARSSATNFALTNTVSSLIEVRGVGLGRTSFKRRIYTTFLIASSYMKTASKNKNKIKEEIKKATTLKKEVVVTSDKSVYKGKIQAIDIDANNIITLDVIKRDGLKAKPNLTRIRPSAYLIDAEQKEIISKIKTLGLIVEEIPQKTIIGVDTYKVKHYKKDSFTYEKMYRQSVVTELIPEKKEFKKGTYKISMNQRKSNILPEILEPEAVNSFVSLGVLKTSKKSVLPIYRMLKND